MEVYYIPSLRPWKRKVVSVTNSDFTNYSGMSCSKSLFLLLHEECFFSSQWLFGDCLLYRLGFTGWPLTTGLTISGLDSFETIPDYAYWVSNSPHWKLAHHFLMKMGVPGICHQMSKPWTSGFLLEFSVIWTGSSWQPGGQHLKIQYSLLTWFSQWFETDFKKWQYKRTLFRVTVTKQIQIIFHYSSQINYA